MTLRAPFKPLRPDLDNFLFAEVGDDGLGIPLSVASALTRLGLDPWDEAGRLSSLNKREAVESLARLIAELPGTCRPPAEAGRVAGGLIERLPQHDSIRPPPHIKAWQGGRWPTVARSWQLWILCAVAAGAAIFSMLAHGGFPFG